MKLTVNHRAAAWYQEEVGLRAGAGIRFKIKIYGNSPINSGYGIAIEPTEPERPAVMYQADNGLAFFIEESDLWFFNDFDLNVAYNEQIKEPYFQYFKEGRLINE